MYFPIEKMDHHLSNFLIPSTSRIRAMLYGCGCFYGIICNCSSKDLLIKFSWLHTSITTSQHFPLTVHLVRNNLFLFTLYKLGALHWTRRDHNKCPPLHLIKNHHITPQSLLVFVSENHLNDPNWLHLKHFPMIGRT